MTNNVEIIKATREAAGGNLAPKCILNNAIEMYDLVDLVRQKLKIMGVPDEQALQVMVRAAPTLRTMSCKSSVGLAQGMVDSYVNSLGEEGGDSDSPNSEEPADGRSSTGGNGTNNTADDVSDSSESESDNNGCENSDNCDGYD